jgi:hypothetical protein
MEHIVNIVGQEEGLFSAMLGEAHQHIIAGLLMRAGFPVATAPVRTGAYDLIITAYRNRASKPEEQVLLRAQCRTVGKTMKLIGGTRGGVDRQYVRPSPKEYKYTEEHNDLVIGIHKQTLDLYIVPTRFTINWGKSVYITRLNLLKWRFDLLLNWRDDYLEQVYRELYESR